MPQCLVATVAPCAASRPAFLGGSSKGKRLSAPGCKEFAIGGQAMPMMAVGQPQRPRANVVSKIDEQAPYARKEQQDQHDFARDSDDEVFVLCPQCHLPLGDSGYTKDDDEGRLVHGECKAQLILRAAKKEEDNRLKKDAALKKKRREEYDLGWKVERVPRNFGPASKLDCGALPNGLCSIVWNQKTKTVGVMPSPEHAASVNLEYLSMALRVRIQEGREAVFSLDPKVSEEPRSKDKLWQVKRFEPAWLEGTSVGEVMFQADYHLKELSMGEYSQPVVGMKSSFDYSEEEGLKQEWSAREWFVVKQAEVQLTDENVVVPVVKMGVEARETRKGDSGLEDVPLTRPDHPLVKYAESFTHYFDLIAERKSVVYHLRELAKASVLAKFLVENEAHLDDRWTSLAGAPLQPVSSREIPQLWNEHREAQIQVRGGQIMGSEEGIQTRMLGVYGGVDVAVARVGVRAPPGKVTAARVPTLTARMISARGAVPEFAVGAPGVPKGVDLGLDKFELTAAEKATEDATAAWSGKDFMGSSFWQSLSAGALAEEHQSLLKDVFHQALSDRRDEGEMFVPPSNSLPYVSALQQLVKEEAIIRKGRKERFLSADFAMSNAGPLFPASWTPSLDVATGERPAGARQGLHPRPDYKADAARLIKAATPVFDKSTEDGTRFRIYQVGNIEVRSTQELSFEEEVGAVFSSRAAVAVNSTDEQWSTIAKVDHIVKVSEYVEKTPNEVRRFYVVLETDQGDLIVTEKSMDRTVVWAENPSGIEYRNSLAKVIRSADLSNSSFKVRDAKRLQQEMAETSGRSNHGACKHYAHDAFLTLLPARLKAFAALSERERRCAEELGAGSPNAWEGRAEVFSLSWSALGSIRQEAAMELGFSEESWGPAGVEKKENKPKEAKKDERNWEQLSQEEREERMEKWFNETYSAAMMGGMP